MGAKIPGGMKPRKKKPTQKDIAWNSAVIACAAVLVKINGANGEAYAREVLQEMSADLQHGDSGDIAELRLHCVIDDQNRIIR